MHVVSISHEMPPRLQIGVMPMIGLRTLCLLATVFLFDVRGTFAYENHRYMVTFPSYNESYTPWLCLKSPRATVNVSLVVISDKIQVILKRTIQRGKTENINLPPSIILKGPGVEIKGVWIVATDSIDVFASHPGAGSAGTFQVHPMSDLGKNYVLLTGQQPPQHVSIAAMYNDTTVKITKLKQISATGDDGLTPKIDEYSLNFRLSYLETRTMKFESDLQVMRISASKNISVLSFAENGSKLVTSVDHLTCSRTVMPISKWGKSFFTMPLTTGQDPGSISIIAQSDNTSIAIQSAQGETRLNLADNEVIHMLIEERDSVFVNSTNQVLLSQHFAYSDGLTNGTTMWLQIEPMEKWTNHYKFESPLTTTVFLIAHFDVAHGLLLDDQPFNASSHGPVSASNTNYTLYKLTLEAGNHSVGHSSTNVSFFALEVPPSPCFCCGRQSTGCTRLDINTSGTEEPYQIGYVVLDEDVTTKVQFHVEADQNGRVINFHEADSFRTEDIGLSAAVIAVIVSLSSALFFVIVCLLGFVLAEVSCRREAYSTSKVSPVGN